MSMTSSKKPRVVIDTNIFISAILYGGNAEKILRLFQDSNITLIVSPETTVELFTKLQKFSVDRQLMEDLDAILDAHTFKVIPKRKIKRSRDPADDIFLEAAVAGRADYIITGDKDLLVLHHIDSIRIVSPKEFLDIASALR